MAGHPLINRSTAVFAYVAFDPVGLTQDPEFARIFDQANNLSHVIGVPFLNLSAETDGHTFCAKTVSYAIASASRRSLILCGGLLEGAVTQIAISALLDGYDVFVVDDLCLTEQTEYRRVFIDRIKDCGGSFVTARQVLHDVSAHHPEDYPVDELKRALEQFPR